MEPKSVIDRLRRQIHCHSVAYYFFTPVISDHTFDEVTKTLLDLQAAYPGVGDYLPEHFDGWEGETGMHFPVTEDVVEALNKVYERLGIES